MAAAHLTPDEVVARWCGRITKKTLANWRCDAQGDGPEYVRFGGRILYPVEKLEAWENRRGYSTTKEYGKHTGAALRVAA